MLLFHTAIDLAYWTFLIKLIFWLPLWLRGKESTCNVGDLGLIPGLGRSPGEGNGYPLQYSSLENFMYYSPWGSKESDTTEQLSLSLSPIYYIEVKYLMFACQVK